MKKEEKVYIPKDEILRIEIIQLHYNMPVAKYKKRQKITELVMRNYWQPEITRNVEKYVKRYDIYQRMKNKIEAPVGKLKLNEILEKP